MYSTRFIRINIYRYQDVSYENVCQQINLPPILFILVQKKINSSLLQVSVSLKESGRYISRLILISQSKRIEVSEGTFENPGSYIQTLTGKLSEDSDDDFKVYTIQNRFEKSKSSQLNLKLTGIQDSCWILNLVVITTVIWVVRFQMDRPEWKY